jgi:hypothetical protein
MLSELIAKFSFSEENKEDPELTGSNDIGFPFLRPARSTELRQRLDHLKAQRKDTNLEKLARNKKRESNRRWIEKISRKISFLVDIDLDATKSEWLKTAGPFHIRRIAEHYGVFEDLFGKYAYFTPRINLDIKVSNRNESAEQFLMNFLQFLSSPTATSYAQCTTETASSPPMQRTRQKWNLKAATRCGLWCWQIPTDI